MLAMCVTVVVLGAADRAGALHLLPVLALVIPLVFGRYPGERLLLRLGRGRRTVRVRPARQCRPRSRQVCMPRRVVAWSLACRPPPALHAGA